MNPRKIYRTCLAECVGTALLLTAVVGSGIMGTKLAGGNDGIALLANSLATGGALIALISALGPVSGAHFNPAVTAFAVARKEQDLKSAAAYIVAQLTGAVLGVVIAHAMFELPLLQQSMHERGSTGELIGEIVATFGLLLTIWGTVRTRAEAVPYTVAAYIVGAYWFTSSTSFANPAVTIARSLTDTFAGIAPASVPGFIAAQLLGLTLAAAVCALLSAEDGKA